MDWRRHGRLGTSFLVLASMACGAEESGAPGRTRSASNEPPCLSDPSEVVLIGDSYITGFFSPALPPALTSLYASAREFRNYAIAGYSLATGGLGTIDAQLDWAVSVNPNITLMIMDGGGSDILVCDTLQFPGCQTDCNRAGSSTKPSCAGIVDAATAEIRQLMARAADAGIKDIIYFFYPHITADDGGYQEILDYAEPLVRQTCDDAAAQTGGRVICHFVDLIQPFTEARGDMNAANFSALDGIHPTRAGQGIIAQQIWAEMENNCLGQPSSSGCCVP